VLSKPLTRPAFVVSKIIANSAGILVTMVIVPCLIAFVIISFAQSSSLYLLGYLEAMGVFFISHFFFLALTLMLGTLFDSRGPVIGIPLGLLFMQQNLIGFIPALGYILPWNLIVSSGSTPPLVLSLMMQIPVQPGQLINLAFIVVESIIFIFIGLWRFNREEF
jgi:ABC-2 type transport system permease protein